MLRAVDDDAMAQVEEVTGQAVAAGMCSPNTCDLGRAALNASRELYWLGADWMTKDSVGTAARAEGQPERGANAGNPGS